MQKKQLPQRLRGKDSKCLLKQWASSVHLAGLTLSVNRSSVKVKSKTNSCSRFSLFHVDQKGLLAHLTPPRPPTSTGQTTKEISNVLMSNSHPKWKSALQEAATEPSSGSAFSNCRSFVILSMGVCPRMSSVWYSFCCKRRNLLCVEIAKHARND